MKLNFWQWIGVLLLVGAAVLYFAAPRMFHFAPAPSAPATQPVH